MQSSVWYDLHWNKIAFSMNKLDPFPVTEICVLTDTRQDISSKLEFKQRVSIALGAAKGT